VAVVGACHSSYAERHKQKDCGTGQPQHKVRPYLKDNYSKKGWWYGSSREHLSSKHRALNSNSQYQYHKKKEEKKTEN
jgi:hypothetical protein